MPEMNSSTGQFRSSPKMLCNQTVRYHKQIARPLAYHGAVQHDDGGRQRGEEDVHAQEGCVEDKQVKELVVKVPHAVVHPTQVRTLIRNRHGSSYHGQWLNAISISTHVMIPRVLHLLIHFQHAASGDRSLVSVNLSISRCA